MNEINLILAINGERANLMAHHGHKGNYDGISAMSLDELYCFTAFAPSLGRLIVGRTGFRHSMHSAVENSLHSNYFVDIYAIHM